MPFHFLTIPVQDSGEVEAQLNAFLGSHRVVGVDRRWVEQGGQSFWSFCIDYLPQAANGCADMPPTGDNEWRHHERPFQGRCGVVPGPSQGFALG